MSRRRTRTIRRCGADVLEVGLRVVGHLGAALGDRVGLVARAGVDALLGRRLVGAGGPPDDLGVGVLDWDDALVGRLGPFALLMFVHGALLPGGTARQSSGSIAVSASARTASGARAASMTAKRSGSAAASSS